MPVNLFGFYDEFSLAECYSGPCTSVGASQDPEKEPKSRTSQTKINVCLNCTRSRCTGHCDKFRSGGKRKVKA